MKETRATLEVIAPTVEEAVAKGLADLGLSEDAVEVEVLDQGSRGLFGLGSRQARVRLAVKNAPPSGPEPDTAVVDTTVKEAAVKTEAAPQTYQRSTTPAPEAVQPAAAPFVTPGDDNDLQVATAVVSELLDKMNVRATVTSHYGQVDEERNRVPILVDVHGEDLSILIGRRAETLNAFQYIASLIVSKELGRPVTLTIDVEGYRSRREGQIRQLARRMADQAVKTGRRQVLEPMPANERRLVHIELRNNPNVSTESVGEEPRRKVTIIPKE